MPRVKPNDSPVKKSRGRPLTYKEEYNRQAEVACENFGATHAVLAKLFNVTINQIFVWERTYPEFKMSLRRGLDKWNCNVAEKSLIKLVTGFEYEEVSTRTTTFKLKDKDVEVPAVERTVIRKYVKPEFTAIAFFLQNRTEIDPETGKARWVNVRHVEASGRMDHNYNINLEGMSDEDLIKLRDLVAKAASLPGGNRLAIDVTPNVTVHPKNVAKR